MEHSLLDPIPNSGAWIGDRGLLPFLGVQTPAFRATGGSDGSRGDALDDEPSKRDANTSAVPGGRWSRLARLGALAGGVAGSRLAEGTRQFAQGERRSAV